MIEQYLGIKNSTRDLSDEKFLELLPQLAEELANIDYTITYSDSELRKDWAKLIDYIPSSSKSSSSVRVGMKLCEHFFPNFYDIQNNKGDSFKKFWTADKLQKVLTWNRKSHSTPYLSELRRGVYFCNGLTKNTMFRPHLAKIVSRSFDSTRTLDPCCGWGGRMIGTVSSGAHYIGFDPNPETFANLKRLAEFLNIENMVTLINDGAENMNKYDFDDVDVVLTSPPYFNLEVYHNGKQQSENNHDSYVSWRDNWLNVVIKNATDRLTEDGHSCWNVHNIGKMKLIDDVETIHNELGFHHECDFSLSSSARQSNQDATKNKKNNDLTRVFNKQ